VRCSLFRIGAAPSAIHIQGQTFVEDVVHVHHHEEQSIAELRGSGLFCRFQDIFDTAGFYVQETALSLHLNNSFKGCGDNFC
jgi:hypothetical protein